MHRFGGEARRRQYQRRRGGGGQQQRRGKYLKQQLRGLDRRARTGRRRLRIKFNDDRGTRIGIGQHHDGEWLHDLHHVTMRGMRP